MGRLLIVVLAKGNPVEPAFPAACSLSFSTIGYQFVAPSALEMAVASISGPV
jgi:hypothetical protein